MPKPPINYTPVTELSEPLVKVYEQLTDELLINIARHFNVNDKASGTLEWQYTKLAEIGKLTDESINIIAKSTGLSSALVKSTIEAAALEAINKIEPDLLKAAKAGLLDTTQATISDTVKRILNAYQQQTIDALNMVNTTMLQSTLDAYRMAVANTANFEKAITAAQKTLNVQTANVITGVSSRTEAVRKAIKQMSANGITGFIDRAGHNWSAEAYVNMDIRTTSGNVALQSTMSRNADYGNDLVWVPINATARPKCYPWQGKVISTANRSGTVEDLNGKVYDITPLNQTSYGEPDGLFGINCHHTPPNVFIAGVSVIRGTVPPKEENDRRYAETQTQRKLERDVRYAKRDALMAQASGDDEAFKAASLKVKEATAEYKQYSKDHNLPTYLDRTQVNEYNRSVAAKANWAARKAVPPAVPASTGAVAPVVAAPPAPSLTPWQEEMKKRFSFNPITGAHTAEQDAAAVNPNYATDRHYKNNCQRCVLTYEMRRRGLNVEALPTVSQGRDDYEYGKWRRVFKGATTQFLKGKTGKAQLAELEAIAAANNNSRYIVRVEWQGGNYGHVFIMENDNGVVKMLDPQKTTRDCKGFFAPGRIKPSRTNYMRVDNLTDVEDFITECMKNVI